MMNICNRIAIINFSGKATVQRPGYLAGLKKEDRYRFTSIDVRDPTSTSPKKSRRINAGSPAAKAALE